MLFFTSYYYLFLSPHAVALMRLCRSLNPAAGCQLVWHWLIRFPVSGSVAGPARDCAWSAVTTRQCLSKLTLHLLLQMFSRPTF